MSQIQTSCSALEFMERCGIVVADQAPRARINLDALKVAHLPLRPPQPGPAFMREVTEGAPPTDNAGFVPWPNGIGRSDELEGNE